MSTNEIYPGSFTPEKETIEKHLHIKEENDKCLKPAANIKETDELINVDLLIPGVKRESFIIEVDKNDMIITVVQREYKPERCTYHLHEFDIITYKRRFRLPQNADLAFIHATYRDGILNIIVPKSENPMQLFQKQIFVY